jgi:PiT family inorganic phosphate transporter
MTLAVALLVAAVLFLSYGNGANDNFKGVATLYGSRTAGFGRCLAWATVTTLAGSLLALVLAAGLVSAFSGKGLVPDAVAARPEFLGSVALGAACTVMLATLTGLPVSTTHALTGALVGAGMVAAGPGEVRFAALGGSFLVPLLVSPLLALAATVAVYPVLRLLRRASGVTAKSCVCVGGGFEEVEVRPDGTAVALRAAGEPGPRVWAASECVGRYEGGVLGLRAGPAVDALHFLSAGAVGFARGLNDTPKIVALLIAAAALEVRLSLARVGGAMALGGALNARRVAETMGRRIAAMNPGQGLTANLVTAAMVTLASRAGLPVSTTHVSVGSVFGLGLVNGSANARTMAAILAAWVTTLPMGAVLAALAYLLLGALPGSAGE